MSYLLKNIFFQKIIKVVVIIIFYFLGKNFFFQLINLLFKNLEKNSLIKQKERLKTLKYLLKNLTQYLLLIIFFLFLLQQFGVDVTPLITGVGILGLAFSFGSQTLVKDIIAGFFIILENQYNVGDKVQLNTEKGTVHKITLRSTILKDEKNNLIYLPNSEIKKVIVFNKN